MDKVEVKQTIEKLKKVINRHRYFFHVLDKEEISQEALDSLKHELYNLEQQFPELISLDSPTQRVGGEALKGFKKVKHEIPMLSIEDVFFKEELEDWEKYLKRLMPNSLLEYFVEAKIDGFAVSLIYKDNIFKIGATRGDGKIGEDVTQNLKSIESIPLKLEKTINKSIVEIRGEVYMEKRDFKKLNKELEEKGEKTYSNPRNLAVGSIRQLDPKLVVKRPLKFLAYDIVSDIEQKKHSEEHQLLPGLGFKADLGRVCKNISEVVDFWREIARKRETLPYQIDGVVITVNDNSFFQKLGVVGKSPRGIRAFKFSPKQATTKVLDVKIQVGRTGAVTPIAQLKAVEIGGTIVTKATLHNEDEINRLNVKIGDTVIVERAGDVIPAVDKVLTELRTGKEKEFHFPKDCPICKTKLVRPKGEVVWRCPNPNCQARKKQNLRHFVSKKAFDIDGLGPKIIDQLMNEHLISQFPDLFSLKEGDLVPLERFAEKSAKNLVLSIENSKEITLAKFIYSLGIRHVGEETAIDLANYFGSLNKVKKTSKEDLGKIPDIGSKVSSSIFDWFQLKKNQTFLDDLIKAGIKILPPERVGEKLKGNTFVLTGSLETMTRLETEKKIRLFGGHSVNSISKATDYLLVGKDPGSKLDKAKKLGVKIIKEEDFLEMIK